MDQGNVLVFLYDHYYPAGGFFDCVGRHRYIGEALTQLYYVETGRGHYGGGFRYQSPENPQHFWDADCVQIVDMDSGEVLYGEYGELRASIDHLVKEPCTPDDPIFETVTGPIEELIAKEGDLPLARCQPSDSKEASSSGT